MLAHFSVTSVWNYRFTVAVMAALLLNRPAYLNAESLRLRAVALPDVAVVLVNDSGRAVGFDGNDLIVIDPERGSTKVVRENVRYTIELLGFSNDNRIIYSKTEDEVQSIISLPISGKGARTLLHRPSSEAYPQVLVNHSGEIAYRMSEEDGKSVVAFLSSKGRKRVALDVAIEPLFLSDDRVLYGKYGAYNENSGSYERRAIAIDFSTKKSRARKSAVLQSSLDSIIAISKSGRLYGQASSFEDDGGLPYLFGKSFLPGSFSTVASMLDREYLNAFWQGLFVLHSEPENDTPAFDRWVGQNGHVATIACAGVQNLSMQLASSSRNGLAIVQVQGIDSKGYYRDQYMELVPIKSPVAKKVREQWKCTVVH